MKKNGLNVFAACGIGVLATGMAGLAGATPVIIDDFESSAIGAFPSDNWLDLGDFSVPSPAQESGQVIETVGRDGEMTRAFQLDQRRTRSQGLLAEIDVSPTYRLEADLRVDAPTANQRAGDWTAGMGFFQLGDSGADINQNPQAVVFVFQERFWFFGGTSTTNAINVRLGDAAVVEGDWYGVSLEGDATTGTFSIEIRDAGGELLIESEQSIPNYDAAFGAYNRIAFFDGEYSGGFGAAGQFSVDNIAFVPAPGTLAVGALGLLGLRRRR